MIMLSNNASSKREKLHFFSYMQQFGAFIFDNKALSRIIKKK